MLWMVVFAGPVGAEETRPAGEYLFGVLPQRSALMTAQYWNPILEQVSRQAGIRLTLKTTRTAPEFNQALERGEYDLVYSNTVFLPRLSARGYRAILKPRAAAIRGHIVTLETSGIDTLEALRGQTVGFPSRGAFVGYAVPMDHLLRMDIRVQAVFGGNQEGIMGQLKAGKVMAAGVNSELMRIFAQREKMRYRVLWESAPFENLPIAVLPRVAPEVIDGIQRVFAGLHDTPEGQRILGNSAAIIQQPPPFGFLPAGPENYQNYVEFYRTTLVQDIE
ncbi:MAG: phosphate/phosphite/phosphonate ABC transporter substrate-binding protein [Magnetococcales bacterium]|nr:phosphate/phosphite/phosphonate ABC transporter substrate-binding protein [Magnetococcales bacterium]